VSHGYGEALPIGHMVPRTERAEPPRTQASQPRRQTNEEPDATSVPS
jgi:hypothetical protein